jgi:hypothetical protein
VYIEAGKANVVAIEIATAAPQWNTKEEADSDFKFWADIPNPDDYEEEYDVTLSIQGRRLHVYSGAGHPMSGLPDKAEFVMGLRIQGHPGYEPLILADVQTFTYFEEYYEGDEEGDPIEHYNLTLAGAPVARLLPRYINDWFPPVDFVPIGFKFEEDSYTFTVNDVYTRFSNLSEYAEGEPLPKRDVDALFQFDLKYRAFGFEGSGGRVWTIRNGLYNTPDDQPELDGAGNATGGGAGGGSYFPVIFGDGTPPEKKGLGTIIYVD